jgi:hypothetical protein
MAVPKKRLRAKRARIRQAERRGTDLRSRYRRGDLPPAPDLAIVEFEDPYSNPGWINPEGTLDPNARQLQARRADGGLAQGAPEWTAPPRPRIRAIVRLKEDPLGKIKCAASDRSTPISPTLNGGDGIPDTTDAAMHAGAGELGDPKLRRGRPNGAG